MSKQRIVVVGGGFAGVKCARTLAKGRSGAEVVLFSRDNHMVFTPLLADVAGSSLSPRAVVAPLRQMLPRATCRAEEVVAIDPEAGTLEYRRFDGGTGEMAFDELVLAVGNRVDLGRVPGMVTYALPLKSVGDAIAMRMHVMKRMEEADSEDDAELRRWLLSFVVIGGGFSGVEVAGELNDLTRHALKYYPRLDAADIRVTLIHSRDQILPEVNPKLRDFARRKMEKAGVEFVLEQRAQVVTRRGVQIGDGRWIEGGSVICTIGNTANPIIAQSGLPTERGRLVCEPDMRVRGYDNIWAVGDCALVPNAQDGQLSPPTAQFAERQGGQTAANIQRKRAGQATKPFRFKPVGVAAGIGSYSGVAELFGIRLAGFIAFWMWRSAFLVKLPSFLQKLKVGLDWAWEMVFPREIAVMNIRPSEPVSRAFFVAGETIFDRDDAVHAVYVIERGECEIVLPGVDGRSDRVLMVLGRGELVGPPTLASYGDDRVAFRARENTEMLVMADDFLERMSDVLKPVGNMLRQALHARDQYWKTSPEAEAALESVTAGELMREPPRVEVDGDTAGLAAFRKLREAGSDFALITREARLTGIVTRTDLIVGLEKGAGALVSEVMTRDPLTVRTDDTAAVAAGSMREHGLKWLPVRAEDGSLAGVLHAEDVVGWVLDRVALVS